jgi:hypothetical protein
MLHVCCKKQKGPSLVKVMALRNPLVVAWLHHPDTPDVSAPKCGALEPMPTWMMNMRER